MEPKRHSIREHLKIFFPNLKFIRVIEQKVLIKGISDKRVRYIVEVEPRTSKIWKTSR